MIEQSLEPQSPNPGVRVLVCGGRDYADQARVWAHLDVIQRYRGISCIIAGAASGADRLAASWAASNGVTLAEYPANWLAHGRAAGPIRNRQMISEGKPDEVVAFPGGRGTSDMVNAARAAGIPVWSVT